MSTTKRYTPAQAAQLLDCHANTVRKWIADFGDVLSEDATGRPRLLRESDIATLQIAGQLRSEGVSVADVLLRLREIPVADRQSPTVDVTTQPTGDSTQLPALIDVGAVLADFASVVDNRITAVQEDVRRVDERLTQAEKQRSVWTGVAIGIAVGVTLGVIIAAILLRL